MDVCLEAWPPVVGTRLQPLGRVPGCCIWGPGCGGCTMVLFESRMRPAWLHLKYASLHCLPSVSHRRTQGLPVIACKFRDAVPGGPVHTRMAQAVIITSLPKATGCRTQPIPWTPLSNTRFSPPGPPSLFFRGPCPSTEALLAPRQHLPRLSFSVSCPELSIAPRWLFKFFVIFSLFGALPRVSDP